jgi:subtilisin family serine protease
MNHGRHKLFLAFGFAASVAFTATPGAAQSELGVKARNMEVIAAKLQDAGKSRVIVEFSVPKSNLRTQAAMAARKDAVRTGQDQILNAAFGSLAAAEKHALSRMSIQPKFALSVNRAELETLAADSRVTRIFPDKIVKLNLRESVPLIGADDLQHAGGKGDGFIVAIVDTGVERTHDFLRNRVIAGACFGTNDEGYVSTCKNGKTEDFGKKAGNPCTVSSSCYHGTHVAGIAAGRLKNKAAHAGEPKVGVAPKASIIAINVFSSNAGDLGAFDSDIEKALEYVLERRNDFEGLAVASINMSLGDSSNNTVDCDDADPLTDVVNDLREANIATVIASGNASSRNGVSAPGCISSAITVSSTTKADAVSSFSNMGSLVDVLAPGSSIRSSVLSNAFGFSSGTSMATPHVTGAWAALRSLHPDASVDEIEAALEDTGVSIFDQRSGGSFTKPRIQIDDAHAAIVD